MPTKYLSYTYFIRWSIHDRQYYGVRYTEQLKHRSPDEDLWIYYFSSSPRVKEFRKENGEPDIILIDKTFADEKEARKYEIRFLKENDVVNDERWLNESDRPGPPIIKGKNHHAYGKPRSEQTKKKISDSSKNKILSKKHKQNLSKSLSGRKLSEEHKQNISDGLKGKPKSKEHKNHLSRSQKNKVVSDETRQKLSNALKGEKNPNFGKPKSDETKQKLSDANKGEKHHSFSGYYITPVGKFASIIEAQENGLANISVNTIRNWCKNNQRIITKLSISRSNYLTSDMIGKTYKEIGFDFEPKC